MTMHPDADLIISKTAGGVPLNLAVLDMAGTTVDATDEVPEALRDAFGRFGMRLTPEAIAGIRGQSKREAIKDLVARLSSGTSSDHDLSEHIFASFRRSMHDRYVAHVAPIPGAVEAMRWLRSRKIAVVLTTGFDRELANLLVTKLGWEKSIVTGVVCADDVRLGRPDPEMIMKAMTVTSIQNPAAVAVVGDTTVDLEAADRAGAGYIIGVLSGAHSGEQLARRRHTVLLNSVADLPAWIESHVVLE